MLRATDKPIQDDLRLQGHRRTLQLQRPLLHSTLCTAWVALSKHGIIGPYWFEDDDEHAMTVNTEHYLQILRKFLAALGQRRRVVRADQWFQHDGATPHTSNDSLNWLRQLFPDRLISRRFDPEWARPEPSRLSSLGPSEGQCVHKQSTNNS